MSTAPNDPAHLLASLLKGGQPAADAGRVSAAADDPVTQFTTLARQMSEMQQQFVRQVTGFWTGAPNSTASTDDSSMQRPGPSAAAAPTSSSSAMDPRQSRAAPVPVTDKRFAADAWRDDPHFDLLRRTYLAYSSFLQGTVENVPLDEVTKAQVRYGMRQFVDAMSPANFLATNPEAMQLAVETGGESLTQGMNLFFEDLAKGRISTTDERAFEVGRNVAVTPGKVIFENDLMQLIQYTPATAEVYERPLLMIPPCINKFYILDLQPENSIVRYVREQGHTVFMVSWRNVGKDQGHYTWDDYLQQGVMRAIDIVGAVTRAEKVNTLGFCIGGTLLACALAILRARNEDKVASMTLLTTMLDFSDAGELGALVTPQSVAAREAAIGKGGIMQGKELSFTFSSLRANDLMWQYVVNSYLKGKAPPAFDMLHWNADNTNLAGPMLCWYVRNAYLENNLRVAGKTSQCGEPVDLSLIDVPTFLYASRDDHIVPWQTAYLSNELVAGETTFVLGASGHIAGVINPVARNKRNHWVGGAPGPDAVRWLETARSVPGSWWPEWATWLAQQAGGKLRARKSVGSRKYPPIEPAPGRYVMQKAE